jgi:hypothetical protein
VILSMGYTKVGIKMGLYTRKLTPTGGRSIWTWVYRCTPNNFEKKITGTIHLYVLYI